MLNTVKSFAILAVLLGLMAGCATTQEEVEAESEAPMESEASDPSSGTGVSGTDVTVEEEVDPMEGVPTVFYFEFDSAVLAQDARAALLLHAQNLRGSSETIRLDGHTDERGSREYNMALGERRAHSVRDFLVSQGISGSRIEVVSYGEERPVEAGSNEYAWSRNRRVELR